MYKTGKEYVNKTTGEVFEKILYTPKETSQRFSAEIKNSDSGTGRKLSEQEMLYKKAWVAGRNAQAVASFHGSDKFTTEQKQASKQKNASFWQKVKESKIKK